MRLLAFLLSVVLLTPWVWAGASLDFGGPNYIQVSDHADFFSGTISSCLWLTLDGTSHPDFLSQSQWTGTNFAGLGFDFKHNPDAGKKTQFIWGNGTSGTQINTSVTPSVTTFEFWCFTLNDAGNAFEVFQNNTSVGTSSSTQTFGNSTRDLLIGGLYNSLNVPEGSLDGRAAYVHFYTKVLTGVERAELQFRPCSITENFSLCLPLWGDATEIDLSGLGHTGTVSGATADTNGPPIMIGDAPL